MGLERRVETPLFARVQESRMSASDWNFLGSVPENYEPNPIPGHPAADAVDFLTFTPFSLPRLISAQREAQWDDYN